MNIYALVNWLAAIVLGLFGYVTYSGSTSATTRQHARYALWVAFWAFLMGLYFALSLTSTWNLSLMRLLYWVGLPLFSNFFYFTLVYPSDEPVFLRLRRFLWISNAILFFVYLFSDAVVQGIMVVGPRPFEKPPIYGPLLGVLFTLPYTLYIIGGHLVLLLKTVRAKVGEERRHALYLLGASSLLFLPISISNVFLPFQRTYEYTPFGPPITLLWVAFTAYAIFRHKILKLKILVPQVLALTLIMLVFLNFFLPSIQAVSFQTSFFDNGSGFNGYAAVTWLSAIIIGSFALIIFLGSKKRSSRLYAMTSFWTMLWTLGMGAYHMTNVYSWIMFWGQWNHFMGGAIAATFFYFSFFFPDEKPPPRWVLPTVVGTQLGFLYLYATTTLIIQDSFTTGSRVIDRGWHFGQFGYLFHIFFALYFLGGFLNLAKKIRIASGSEKKDLRYVFWGTVIGVAPAAVVNVALPLVGNFQYYWLGPTLILGWVALLSYAIVRRQLLNVKIVLAEVAVLAMTLILFLNIFLSQVLNYGMIGYLIIFLAFTVVGMFFISSIRRSEAQKEQLQVLAGELRDLTENLQAKVDERTAQLSHSKVHIETLIENLTSGLIEYTNDFVVLRMNRAAERLLDIDRDRVVGKRILPEDAKTAEWRALVAVTYPPEAATTRVEGGLLDEQSGASVHEVVVGAPMNNEYQVITATIRVGSGKPEGFLKVIRDITREKQINRSKSEFISIAAHQLRTPLSALKWCIDLLLKGDFGPVNAKQREMLQRGYETNETMIQLVGDLLNVAKIEDRRFGYEFTKGDLMAIATLITNSLSMTIKERGITFVFDKPQRPFPPFYFDEAKISLAIQNLLENAIHYTPRGGAVTLSIEVLSEQVKIMVRDTGIGIPKKQLDRLFTRFFRAENAMRSHPEGSGLGLFMVQNIIARHGGTVSVQSEENKGTTMTVLLPMPTELPKEVKSVYD